MKIGVRILPRLEVLDTQGRAVERTLRQNGKDVAECRVGKFVQLDLGDLSQEEALAKAKELTEFILYNPLIESYELEVL